MKLRWPRIAWMVAILCLVVLVAISWSAQESGTLGKPQLAEFSALPLYGDDGTLVSFHVTAKFRLMVLQPDGKNRVAQIASVQFDLVQQGGQTAVLGSNHLVEFADIGEDLIAISSFVWKAQHPDPLPQRRRALREQAIPKS